MITNQTSIKDLEINRKFLYFSEVNLALHASIEAAKKYMESIRKLLESVNHLHPKTT